jgi:hypothetical protein
MEKQLTEAEEVNGTLLDSVVWRVGKEKIGLSAINRDV